MTTPTAPDAHRREEAMTATTAPRRSSHTTHPNPSMGMLLTEQVLRHERPVEWTAGLIAAASTGMMLAFGLVAIAMVVTR